MASWLGIWIVTPLLERSGDGAERRAVSLSARLAWGPPLGLGGLALGYLASAGLGLAEPRFLPWLLLVAAAVVSRRRFGGNRPGPIVRLVETGASNASAELGCFAALVSWVALALALWSAIGSARAFADAAPLGSYDAVAIWSYRARVLHRGWSDLPGGLEEAGYPLLLPAAVAAQQATLGNDAPAIARATGLAFAVSALAAVAWAGGRGALGRWAVALLLVTPGWLGVAFAQEADIALSAWLLLAIAAFARAVGPRDLVLAGLAAGGAIWTKSEGALFVGLGLAAVLVARRLAGRAPTLRHGVYLLAGAVPGIAARVLELVLWPAARGQSAAGFLGAGALERLTELDRWRIVLGDLAGRLFGLGFDWGALWTLVLLLGLLGQLWYRQLPEGIRSRFSGDDPVGLGWAAVAIAGAWIGIYVLTPQPLAWHLATSAGRLIAQAAPLAVTAAILAARRALAPPTASRALFPPASRLGGR